MSYAHDIQDETLVSDPLKRGIELVRGSKQSEASEAKKLISDPVAKKLLEWIILRSEDLFRGKREIWIEHGEVMYRLRLTSSGKLYLTK